MNVEAGFSRIAELVAGGISDFRVERFDSVNLLVIGSFDLVYYHDVQVEFADVQYIDCPTYFMDPHFRVGGDTERRQLEQRGVDVDGTVYIIDADAGRGRVSFSIVARDVRVSQAKVYHYDRKDLEPGESIAPWVKRDT